MYISFSLYQLYMLKYTVTVMITKTIQNDISQHFTHMPTLCPQNTWYIVALMLFTQLQALKETWPVKSMTYKIMYKNNISNI